MVDERILKKASIGLPEMDSFFLIIREKGVIMKNKYLFWMIALVLLSVVRCHAGSYELGTVIEKKGEILTLTGSGYTRLSLVRFKTNATGTVHLNGTVAVNQGSANMVMWSKVKGKFYYSRMPALQNFRGEKPSAFSIPFSSPKDPVTEVVLEVELPQGGKITVDHLNISTE
jgi:hypothetical protein